MVGPPCSAETSGRSTSDHLKVAPTKEAGTEAGGTKARILDMSPHPMTKRAIKQSAFYAALISAVGLTFALISSLVLQIGLFPPALFTGIIAYLLLIPGMLITWFIFDRFPALSEDLAPYLAAVSSLVVYFGLIFLSRIVYYKVRQPSDATKSDHTQTCHLRGARA
jgi:hypothetical protein